METAVVGTGSESRNITIILLACNILRICRVLRWCRRQHSELQVILLMDARHTQARYICLLDCTRPSSKVNDCRGWSIGKQHHQYRFASQPGRLAASFMLDGHVTELNFLILLALLGGTQLWEHFDLSRATGTGNSAWSCPQKSVKHLASHGNRQPPCPGSRGGLQARCRELKLLHPDMPLTACSYQ